MEKLDSVYQYKDVKTWHIRTWARELIQTFFEWLLVMCTCDVM